MATTLRLNEQDNEALRRVAQSQHLSMQEAMRVAIREYVARNDLEARVDEALDVLTPRYADLLDRLGK